MDVPQATGTGARGPYSFKCVEVTSVLDVVGGNIDAEGGQVCDERLGMCLEFVDGHTDAQLGVYGEGAVDCVGIADAEVCPDARLGPGRKICQHGVDSRPERLLSDT